MANSDVVFLQSVCAVTIYHYLCFLCDRNSLCQPKNFVYFNCFIRRLRETLSKALAKSR